jgi:hypothetical protein
MTPEEIANLEHVPTPTEERHRNMTLLALTAVLIFLIILGAAQVATYFRAGAAADNSSQVARATDLTSCRAKWRGKVDDAVLEFNRANTQTFTFFLDLVAASGDDAKKELIIASASDVNARFNAAFSGWDQANEDYQNAVKQSVEHPDDFLASCRSL